MKKSANSLIAVLLALIFASIIVIVILVSIKNSSESDNYFYPKKKAAAVSLYNTIMELSEETYPQTPDEVVSTYFAGYHLLYGDMIKDESIVTDILIQQRMLLSDDIINSTDIETQKSNLEASLKDLKKNGVNVTFIETKPAIYDNMENACIRVVESWSSLENVTFNYYLKKDSSGKWKITRWEISDQSEGTT